MAGTRAFYNARMNQPAFIDNPRRAFWLLHLGGWLVWGLFKYSAVAVLEQAPPNYPAYVLLIAILGGLLTLALRYLYRAVWNRPLWWRILLTVAVTAAATWVWIELRQLIFSAWFQPERKEMQEEWLVRLFYLGFFQSEWVTILAWSVLYYGIKYYRIFQEVREAGLKAATMAHEAQLKMLRYQLNPHFLFNTLNAISTLILEQQTEVANRMVSRLSSFLRYSLDNDPMQKITLQQELGALELYLDIEKVRFEDRLSIDLDVSGEARGALIPSLLLQPLVENAIKYGIARLESGGVIRIAARVFAGDLLIEISDNGPGTELVNGQIPDARGVGVRNTRERLAELYGNQHSFRLSHAQPQGLTVNIRIPYET